MTTKSSDETNHFCPSPWIHMRLDHDGVLIPCRWMPQQSNRKNVNILTSTLSDLFFSAEMDDVRKELLQDNPYSSCSACYYEDSFNKTSGRSRSFDHIGSNGSTRKTIIFDKIEKHVQLKTRVPIISLQLDIGRACNLGCIMCGPDSSSYLEKDYKKLNKLNPQLFQIENFSRSWADHSDVVDRVCQELKTFSNLRYIHLLGGETLKLKSFFDICEKLVKNNQANKIIIGTTTNGTVHADALKDIVPHFQEFHLGVSVETFDSLNDYIRYPSKIDIVKSNFESFLRLRDQHKNLKISLRITPSVLTVNRLDTIFEFALHNGLFVESCDILTSPSMMRMELLPKNLVNEVINKLVMFANNHNLSNNIKVSYSRDDANKKQLVANRLYEYVHFLQNMETPKDVESERLKLVAFVKAFETVRGNNILEYAPELTDFLRSYGY